MFRSPSAVDRCGASGLHDASSADAWIGHRLGVYELTDVLGVGGMCVVYRARHVELGTEAAVKARHPGRDTPDLYVQRLRREAAAGLRIEHPNVVRVLELGVDPRGHYLVMELLEGRTLYDLLHSERPRSSATVAAWVRQLADGLCAVHRAGFVHRDLKPGNVMLVPGLEGERVKLLDFGIVGVLSGDRREHLTRDDLVLGTPGYMAPEQFQGSAVGLAADLYSLGVVLYHMLSGRPPFEGSFQEIIAQHVMRPPAPLEDAGGLEELAYWLLEKSANRRPRSAEEVVAFIDRHFPPGRTTSDDGLTLAVALERRRGAESPEGTAIVRPIRDRVLLDRRAARSASAGGRAVPVGAASRPLPRSPWARKLRSVPRRPSHRRDVRLHFGHRAGGRMRRRARWRLWIAVPAACSLMLAGGAYAAQRFWSASAIVRSVASGEEKGHGATETSAPGPRAEARRPTIGE